jgi:outer membrane protein
MKPPVAADWRRLLKARPLTMPHLRTLILCAALCLALAGAAAAQPVTPPLPAGVDLTKPLSLADCVRIALAANPGFSIAGQQVRQAQAGVTQIRSTVLPQLGLTGNVTSSGGSNPAGSTLGGIGGSGAYTNGQAALTLSELFYQSGRSEQISAAEATASGSRWNLTDTRRTLYLDVAQNYYTALAAVGLSTVADNAVAASAADLEAAMARISAGVAAQSDRYPFDVTLQQAVEAQIQARNTVRTSLNGLKLTMGLPAETQIQVTEINERPPLPTSVDDLRALAYRQRPDMLRQEAAVESARLARQVARIQQGPVFSVAGSDTLAAANDTVGDGWQGQVAVTVPIFDSGASRSVFDNADAAWRIANEDLRQTQLQVSQDVENGYLNASTANAQIDAAATALKSAQVSFAAAQERYKAGVGTVIDVTDAEQKLRQAESDLVNARYTYNISLVALQAAVGVPQILPVAP